MSNATTDPHQVPEKEAEQRAEAIVRRAIAELRAIDPACDCSVLFGTRIMLMLALDERVFLQRDAFAAIDLVRYLELAQSYRRDKFGYDHATVDGPVDIRAAKEGPLVEVAVRVLGQWTSVDKALAVLDPDGNEPQEQVPVEPPRGGTCAPVPVRCGKEREP